MKFEKKMALTGRAGTRIGTAIGLGLLTGWMALGATRSEAQAAPAASIQASGKLAAAPPVTYDNKFELYGGLNLMTFQAGQALPKRMNLGGGEFLATYWLTKKWGLGAEYRGEAGTTPVLANPYTTRPLVYMNMGLFGAQYRGPRNQHAAINFHGYGGIASGVFDSTTYGIPKQFNNVGLYGNKTSPIFALGGSVDFNRSKRWAIRLSPDLILEHFGTETREFFAISGGVVYRIGKK